MSDTPIARVNYFNGEALLTEDFQDEQAYHTQARELLNEGVFSPGIVEGLDVSWSHSGNQLTVDVGKALDVQGRLIFLATPTAPFTPPLQTGANFLTIFFHEDQTDQQNQPYGQGYKRWTQNPQIACRAAFDSTGGDILLAIVMSSDGINIASVKYNYTDPGNNQDYYARRHIGATLQSINFVDEGNGPGGATGSIVLDQETLVLTAAGIDLNGAVTARNVTSATGNFNGNFSGTFTGDGRMLTLPPSRSLWQPNGDDIYFKAGHVAIGDEDASAAVLTIRKESAPPKVATGLISLDPDGQTLHGYQTKFLSELKAGDVITYDYAPAQTATIVHLTSNTQVEIDKRFHIDLGPSTYSTQRGAGAKNPGPGKVVANDTTVTCIGATFQGIAEGDTLILDASVEDYPKCLRVQSIDSDTKMTVVTMLTGGANAAVLGGPKLSAFSSAQSVLLVAGGVPNQPVGAAPPALAIAENGNGGQMPNTVGINVDGASLDGSKALEVRGTFLLSRWPLDATHSAELLNVGGTQSPAYQGLTVTDNGSSSMPRQTVSINVPTVADSYALDVGGPTRLGSLEVTSDLNVSSTGTLKVGSEIDTDKIGAYTAGGPVEVTSDLVIEKTIRGVSAGGSGGITPTLKVGGNLEVSENATIDGNLQVNGKIGGNIPLLQGPLTIDGPLFVTNGNTVADNDLLVHGDLHVNGALTTDAITVNHHNALGEIVWSAKDDGSLSMIGELTVGPNGNANFTVEPDGDVNVNGSVTVGKALSVQSGDFSVNADGSIRCFSPNVLTRKKTVSPPTALEPPFMTCTANTDGFVVVDVDPDTILFNRSIEVLIDVTISGVKYTHRASAFVLNQNGRGGVSATVPVPKNAQCAFSYRTTGGSGGQADIQITWVPFGSGELTNLAAWGNPP
ncbi:hypothetical protein [Trinickia soli]|uniref:Uncharacterized protein n=1 Tax=Trinickia soli TaxID=380675 RepID=A0A2N7W3V6_9BURK|nr:hypothetical protein [Trinickia soli]PMS24063.1 hypothetical protein C0Z19_14630 [Trinickia soli]CAB3701779.1 hypothetical protein LMG24076_03461 [Trinickia soli]